MKYLKIVLILFVIFYAKTIFAQFPVQGQYQSVYLNQTPPLPNYLEAIVDNSIPSPIQISRISDYYEPWDWYPLIEYAKIQTWNADQTAYKIRSVWVYDAVTHQKINNLPSGSLYPAYWSNTNSDLIYGFRENGDIKTYSLSTEITTTVHSIAGYDVIKLGPGEGNIDKNDKYVALVGKRNTDLDVIIYDLELNQVIHTEIFAGAWGNGQNWSPQYIDWISVSQSGDYVGIMWNHNTTSSGNPFNGHFGVEMYNTTDMAYLRRIAAYGNHGDFGYAADGDEVFVQFWGPNSADHVNMFYLDRLESLSIATHSDFDAAGHISCRNINRPGWTYLTQSDDTQSGQMIALKLDDSGIVEHFGHHFSSSTTYDKVPMAVPSPNGDKVMFKSDFGDAANTDLVYVFQSKKDLSLNLCDSSFVLTLPIAECNCVDQLTITDNPVNGNYKANLFISTNGVTEITSHAIFRAGTSITLMPGFSVLPNATFIASIEPCTDCAPLVLFPNPNEIMDNGCQNGSDLKEWLFNWQTCPNATKYHLYVKATNAQNPIIDNSNINSPPFVLSDNGFITNSNLADWFVQVRAMVGGNWTGWYGHTEATTATPFSVESVDTDCPPSFVPTLKGNSFSKKEGIKLDNLLSIKLKIYPNPSQYNTTIQYNLSQPTKVRLTLFSVTGQPIRFLENNTLQKSGIHQYTLHRKNIPAGIYFVGMQVDKEVLYKKLVIME